MLLRATLQASNGKAAATAVQKALTSSIKLTLQNSRYSSSYGSYAFARRRASQPISPSIPRNQYTVGKQWRPASDRSNSPRDDVPESPTSKSEKAESPWTEEVRSPAPDSNTETSPGDVSEGFKSKLRQQNDLPGLEKEINRIEDEMAQIRREHDLPEVAPEIKGPLPDLRFGIPSSFEVPNSDTSSSFKEKESDQLDLNITEDPASGGGRREEDTNREAYVSSIERRRLMFARYMYIAGAILGLGGFGWLGREWRDEAEATAHPDAPRGMGPMAWYQRFRERLGGQFSYYTEPTASKLLPDQPADPSQRFPYTLVLSLEDLLVHSEWTRQDGHRVAKRPGVDYFLHYLMQYYELVIFTSVQFQNCDPIIRQLDPYGICLPLFREATRYQNGEHIKDLSYLNRPLDKTIVIDTNPAHTSLQPENAIILPKWTGKKVDPNAGDLVALIPFLEYIAGMELSDVRKVLASYHGTHIPTEFYKREAKAREQFLKRRNEEMAKRGSLPGAGALSNLSGALGFKASQQVMQIPGEQTPAEAFAAGKMWSDVIRERGQRGYLETEEHFRKNGPEFLRLKAEDEKKQMEDGLKNVTGGVFGFLPGGGGGGAQDQEKK